MGKRKGKKVGPGDSGRLGASKNVYSTLNDDDDDNDIGAPGRNRNHNNNKKKNKGRKNSSSKTNSDEQLRQSIEADGSKSVIEMAADGNCLFRSLSDQLYHDYGNTHEEVRTDICDFLAGHEEEFSVFLVLDEEEDDEDAADFSDYVDKMRQSGEWGGNVELVVAARLYRRNITVFSTSLAAFTIDHGHPNKQPAGPDLLVSYHDNDHYNSVRDNNKGKPPPPIKTFNRLTEKASPIRNNKDSQSTSDETPDDSGDEEKVKGTTVKKPPKKNDMCPCESGLRYKKCCLARAKHQTRLNRIHGEHQSKDEEPQGDKGVEHEMAGEFRVLKI